MTTNLIGRINFNNSLTNHMVGWDNLLSTIEKQAAQRQTDNYPPFNHIKLSEEDSLLEIAVTSFKKDEITIEVNGDQLTITGKKAEKRDVEYLHRGLASRDFVRSFQLFDHNQVVDAEMDSGLLSIYIKRIVPDELKPKLIDIK